MLTPQKAIIVFDDPAMHRVYGAVDLAETIRHKQYVFFEDCAISNEEAESYKTARFSIFVTYEKDGTKPEIGQQPGPEWVKDSEGIAGYPGLTRLTMQNLNDLP